MPNSTHPSQPFDSGDMPLNADEPVTLSTVLAALREHRLESRLRYQGIADRLDNHAAQLAELPAMKLELEQYTATIKQYADDQAFRRGVNARLKTAGIWGAVVAAGLGIWLSVSQLFGHGPKLPPPGMGPQ